MSSDNEGSSTVTHTETTTFVYTKDSMDLTKYALDYMNNEPYYYPVVQSYTREQQVAIFICVNGLVSAGAYYELSGEIKEYFRSNNTSDMKFNSIQDWYNDYYGESVSIDKVLNNVFIGEDLVPLWKVLLDTMEEDNSSSEDEDEDDEEIITQDTILKFYDPIIFSLSLYAFIIGVGFLTVITLILSM